MGLPVAQVVLIFVRQLSRPVADTIMRYGKTHLAFRDRVLVPVGRGLVNMTTRLRMRNLGLGAPAKLGPISESAALEQASEFVQQCVIFGYSVGVFAAYHYYSKANEKTIVPADDFRKLLTELDTRFAYVEKRIDDIDTHVRSMNKSFVDKYLRTKSDELTNSAKASPPRLASLPFDEALRRVVTSSEESAGKAAAISPPIDDTNL